MSARTTVRIVFALTVAVTAAQADPRPQTANPIPQKGKVYEVATAHLDTNWLWTIQDTIGSHLPKTMNVNFAYFREFPDYVFNFEGAFHYMLMKEYYPERFAELKDWVRQGRWNVAGSWVDAVDTNMPSAESLIRQTLYGNGFFQKEFGKRSVDIFLPDCFGFSYALPSIAAHCGLIGFSTQKLSWGSASGIPFPVGRWEGVDGSSIVAALDPGSYGSSVPANAAYDPKILARVEKTGQASGAFVDYRYHGTGDTGGGPKRESVENLEKNMHRDGPLHILSTATDQLYKDLAPAQIAKLPAYKGELVLTTHGTGCYTSQAVMKKWNRENEQLADAAERAAVFADWLGGTPYPREKLTAAWTRFLWHQFHDDLTGTSIPQVYPFSWNDEVLSMNQFAEVLTNSVGVMAAKMDTRAEGVPLVVYNPLATRRSDVLEATVDLNPNEGIAKATYPRVYSPDGVEVPSQLLSISGKGGQGVRFAFLADVSPLSTTTFDVRRSETPCSLPTGLSVTFKGLENGRYRVAVDADGDVSSIFDKQIKAELLKSPIRLEMRDDLSTNWPAWEILYKTLQGAEREYVYGPAVVKIVENGPARVALEVTRETAGSTFVQRIQLSAGDGARVEFPTTVDWRSRGTLLKAVINTVAKNPNATYDIGLGVISRPNNTEAKYEVPAQKWADLTDSGGAFGVSVLTDCKYGWDKPADDTLRLSLIHTPRAGRGYGFQETNDLGHHEFTYAIVGHTGDWKHGTQTEAQRLNQPLRAFVTTPHPGPSGRAVQFAATYDPSVSVQAIKKAEHSNDVIVRVFEQNGLSDVNATIRFGAPVARVREVNGQEDAIAETGTLTKDGGQIHFSLRPFQPRAFAITFAGPEHSVTSAVSHPLALPFETNVVSRHGSSGYGGFDPEGHAIPAELFPASTESEGVRYKFGPANSDNAVIAHGQQIDLGENPGNRVCILAAATGRDVQSFFRVGNHTEFALIPNYSNRIAQWTNRMNGDQVIADPARFGKPFMKRVPIGWLATHRHDAGGNNQLYTYCYLFKYEFEVPPGTHTLTLPDDRTLRILAVATVETKTPTVTPAADLYR